MSKHRHTHNQIKSGKNTIKLKKNKLETYSAINRESESKEANSTLN